MNRIMFNKHGSSIGTFHGKGRAITSGYDFARYLEDCCSGEAIDCYFTTDIYYDSSATTSTTIAGTIDGMGHSLCWEYVSWFIGPISTVTSTGCIKNINNTYQSSDQNLLVYNTNYGRINNCISSCARNDNASDYGYTNYGTISNCVAGHTRNLISGGPESAFPQYNYNTIINCYASGCITPYMSDDYDRGDYSSYPGGICVYGNNNSGGCTRIENCISDVTVGKYGGIIYDTRGAEDNTSIIRNCRVKTGTADYIKYTGDVATYTGNSFYTGSDVLPSTVISKIVDYQIINTVYPTNHTGEPTITYSSSNPSVATVSSSGLITPTGKKGEVTIYMTASGLLGNSTVENDFDFVCD